MPTPDAAEFDRWYDVLERSPRWRRFVGEQLGLPERMFATGFLNGEGLAEIQSLLSLRLDDTLVELGCGRGGYGLSLIGGVGARLVGVDFSSVALRGAEADAVAYGLADRTTFQLGDLTTTGLPDESASAVVCVDAIQFAASVPDALTESLRILRPSGQLVITTWQASTPADGVPERIRRLDLAHDFAVAGFDNVEVLTRPAWSATERRLWTAALDLDPGEDDALDALRDEAADLLPLADSLHRVVAIGRRPGNPWPGVARSFSLNERSGSWGAAGLPAHIPRVVPRAGDSL